MTSIASFARSTVKPPAVVILVGRGAAREQCPLIRLPPLGQAQSRVAVAAAVRAGAYADSGALFVSRNSFN